MFIRTTFRLAMASWALPLALASGVDSAHGAEPARAFKDVAYATQGGKSLALDIYLPSDMKRPPLVVYVHGGAWKDGSKAQYPTFLVEHGFAVASVDFRSTNEAPFPADVHDIKAGIRFLRGKAAEYGYGADRIAIVGASSGGHLAALVGVTNGDKELEGTEGNFLNQSSSVQAVVSYFGASDLTTILDQSTASGLAMRAPALVQLLGAAPDKVPELARQASPIFHVDRSDPPLLLFHGDQDTQMPLNQLYELQWAYEQVGLHPEVMILHGVGHEGGPFFKAAPADKVLAFLKHAIG